MERPGKIRRRIAIGAILFEGNSLSPRRDDLSTFKKNYYFEGEEVVRRLKDAGVEITGALSVLEETGHEIIPLIATHGLAGGRVTAAAWKILRQNLISRLARAGQVDGVYLALHGAMLCEDSDDPEGDLLEEVRQVIGRTPIAVSCDLHGHITSKMFTNADVLIGYQLYPHDDAVETGQRAAGLLTQMIDGKVRLTSHLCKVPMIVQSQRQRTKGDTPMARLYRVARALEASGQAIYVSYFAVQPWMNVSELGFAAVVIGDSDHQATGEVAREIAKLAWSLRDDFQVPLVSTRLAIENGLARDGGPILLVDASDCVGGGAPGDSAIVLKELLQSAPDSSAAVPIVDADAAEVAMQSGIGSQIRVPLGNKADASYGNPIEVTAQVMGLFDGEFSYSGGILAGDRASMGRSAWIRIGLIDVVVASRPTYEYRDEQFRAAGFDPAERKFIVVKNPMNYQQGYPQAVCAFILDTVGPTTPDLVNLSLSKAGRPFFPFDCDFEPAFEIESRSPMAGKPME